ncbi:hypothetical protein ACFWD7_57565 [Streptomyces mirabilis]|uniref:hypothetical protein n=1 Tax=Streptomyces mirabilis TaxID=68239 RepID=UPI0036B0D25F
MHSEAEILEYMNEFIGRRQALLDGLPVGLFGGGRMVSQQTLKKYLAGDQKPDRFFGKLSFAKQQFVIHTLGYRIPDAAKKYIKIAPSPEITHHQPVPAPVPPVLTEDDRVRQWAQRCDEAKDKGFLNWERALARAMTGQLLGQLGVREMQPLRAWEWHEPGMTYLRNYHRARHSSATPSMAHAASLMPVPANQMGALYAQVPFTQQVATSATRGQEMSPRQARP